MAVLILVLGSSGVRNPHFVFLKCPSLNICPISSLQVAGHPHLQRYHIAYCASFSSIAPEPRRCQQTPLEEAAGWVLVQAYMEEEVSGKEERSTEGSQSRRVNG